MKGSFTTFAFNSLSLTCTYISEPSFASSMGTYPNAIAFCSTGDCVPEVVKMSPSNTSVSVSLKFLVSVACWAVVVGAIYGTMVWATRQSDETAVQRQESLVSRIVSEMQDRIAHDQESATVWDDAVRKVGEGDR